MKINWNFIKGLFLITVTLLLYGFSNYRNSRKKIEKIDIKFEKGENLFMDYQMVNKLLIQNNKSVKNQSKSLIDLKGLESQVKNHPMVESAKTFLTIDGILKTLVKQRMPIGRIQTSKTSYYIDRQGVKMPLSENYSARVPIVTGFSENENLEDLFLLLDQIRFDEFLKKQIVGIHKSPKNDFILFTRVGNQKIVLGTIENLKSKFENLKSFYNYTMVNKTIDNYKKINLKYDKQIVCTKND